MGLARVIRAYRENSRRVLGSMNNPLKRKENTALKARLEREFWEEESKRLSAAFPDDEFVYCEDEDMPVRHRYMYDQLRDVKGMRILDVCCGLGKTTVKLAKRGAIVSSIDISPGMIDLTRRNAERNGVSEAVDPQVMSAEAMTFSDGSFDYAVGLGALHHLNIDLAGQEIARVLKPGGRGIFLEPRIPFNGLIFLRSLFPAKCFESPGGAQLSDREIQRFSGFFSRAEIAHFLFLGKLARLPIIKRAAGLLDRVDWFIINRFGFMRKLYWAFVLQVTR